MAAQWSSVSIDIEGYSDIHFRADAPGVAWTMQVDVDNPFFEGHFPDDPILPAIAQLVLVECLIRATLSEEVGVRRLRRVRFTDVLRPGDRIRVEVSGLAETSTGSFRVLHDHGVVTSGELSLRRRARRE